MVTQHLEYPLPPVQHRHDVSNFGMLSFHPFQLFLVSAIIFLELFAIEAFRAKYDLSESIPCSHIRLPYIELTLYASIKLPRSLLFEDSF